VKNFCFLCLIIIMCGFILTVVNSQENQQHQGSAELEINEIEKRLPEIDHEQQALQEQLQKEIDSDIRHELEKKLVNLVMDELSQRGRLVNLTMERPAPEDAVELLIDWLQKRIEIFDNATNHLHEILEVIHIPELIEKLETQKRNLEDTKNGLKEELRILEEKERQKDKNNEDRQEKKESFWDNLKHPAVIAAIISAIAIIIAAFLKRK